MPETLETPEGTATPLPTAAPGVLLYPEAFEWIVDRLRGSIARLAADEPFQRLAVPPVIARRTIERTGYAASFPNLLGTVHGYTGDARRWAALAPLVEEGGEWHADQHISDLVLLPAVCYPVYESLAGQHLAGPAKYLVEGRCFRHEVTSETGRLRSFRVIDMVTAGDPEHCAGWRDRRLEQAADWLASFALKVSVEEADDPFFGNGRKVYQAAQRAQQLKYELRVPVDGDLVQAVGSANLHKDHFGSAFEFTSGAEPAHTSCIGFGLERIALALINAHGPRPAAWPAPVLAALA